MFQRKQTLFWIASLLLCAVQFFRTYGTEQFLQPNGQILTAAFSYKTYWSVAALLILTTIIQLIVLVLYKKLPLQIRLTGLLIPLQAGLEVMVMYGLYKLHTGGVVTYDIISVFPIIAAILNYFALKRVSADYALLKSLGRIR